LKKKKGKERKKKITIAKNIALIISSPEWSCHCRTIGANQDLFLFFLSARFCWVSWLFLLGTFQSLRAKKKKKSL